MRVVVIGPDEQAALERLRTYAEAAKIPFARVWRSRSGGEPPVASDPNASLILPGGLMVVLSLEEHGEHTVRHASFLVFPRDPKNPLPHPELVEMILPFLGFQKPLKESTKLWVEFDAVVNVAQIEEVPK